MTVHQYDVIGTRWWAPEPRGAQAFALVRRLEAPMRGSGATAAVVAMAVASTALRDAEAAGEASTVDAANALVDAAGAGLVAAARALLANEEWCAAVIATAIGCAVRVGDRPRVELVDEAAVYDAFGAPGAVTDLALGVINAAVVWRFFGVGAGSQTGAPRHPPDMSTSGGD